MFNLIIILICSIFGAFFINKVLEEITSKSGVKRKLTEKETTTNNIESAKELISTSENTSCHSPQGPTED